LEEHGVQALEWHCLGLSIGWFFVGYPESAQSTWHNMEKSTTVRKRGIQTGFFKGDSSMLRSDANQPLLISSLIDFADKHHGDAEVVSRRVEGDIHRYTWSDVADARSRQVANALDGMKLAFR
jgi:hypothetical protein